MIQHGIILLTSPQYKLFVNGQEERFNRTIRERVLNYNFIFKWKETG